MSAPFPVNWRRPLALRGMMTPMSSGPIEIIEILFPDARFDGSILAELERLVEAGTISIIDGVLVTRGDDDELTILEVAEIDDDELSSLAGIVDPLGELISDEDVEELAQGLAPGDAAAILVFEHTWALPLRDAIVGAGGHLAAQLRVPGAVVDEVLREVAALADD
jgi:hypothetical protein